MSVSNVTWIIHRAVNDSTLYMALRANERASSAFKAVGRICLADVYTANDAVAAWATIIPNAPLPLLAMRAYRYRCPVCRNDNRLTAQQIHMHAQCASCDRADAAGY